MTDDQLDVLSVDHMHEGMADDPKTYTDSSLVFHHSTDSSLVFHHSSDAAMIAAHGISPIVILFCHMLIVQSMTVKEEYKNMTGISNVIIVFFTTMRNKKTAIIFPGVS